MEDSPEIGSRSLAERVALLGLAELAERGETPAHSFQVKEVVVDHLEAVDAEALGRLTEKEIVRALNRLETTELVSQTDRGTASNVGKGRPAYALEVEATEVFETVGTDDRTAELVDRVRSGS